MFVVKVPGVNGLGKTAGARDAGNEIIAELHRRRVEGLRVEEIHVDNDDLPRQEALIVENAKEAFEENDRVLFLGGDHSISYPLGKAFFEVYGGNKADLAAQDQLSSTSSSSSEGVCLVVFDAHADCMEPMQEPTHEEWLRALLERTGLKGEDVLLVGAREIEPEEEKFLEDSGVQRIPVQDIREDLEGVVARVQEFVSDRAAYVSFDVDVLDDRLIQSTGYPVEGGLELREAKALIAGLVELEEVKGFDVVELHADKEGFEKDLKRVGELVEVMIR